MMIFQEYFSSSCFSFWFGTYTVVFLPTESKRNTLRFIFSAEQCQLEQLDFKKVKKEKKKTKKTNGPSIALFVQNG